MTSAKVIAATAAALSAIGYYGARTREAASVSGAALHASAVRQDDEEKPVAVEPPASQPEQAAPTEHAEAEHDEHASHELVFDAEALERLGITLTTVKAATIRPELRAIGFVEEDPAQPFTVRAPLAGFLQAAGDQWPALGATVDDHALLGSVQPRLLPLEQFALAGQRLEAHAALAEIEADLAAAQASYESKRTLNAEGKVVSDRQFEEAETKLKITRARLAGAQQKLELLEQQHGQVQRGLQPLALEALRGGQVTEVLAAPGEAVESGQPLLRITRRDRLIARIELPLGSAWDSPAADARIAVIGAEDQPMAVKTIGRAPHAGARTHGQAWLLSIERPNESLSPGTPLIAFLPTGGQPLEGVVIPSSAVLRYGGLTWVYVRGAHDDRFERQAVRLHTPTPAGWFVTAGLEPGATIVEQGAQLLLSEQLKAQIEAEAEAAE